MKNEKYVQGNEHAAEPLGDLSYLLVDPFDSYDVWGSVMMSAFMVNDVLVAVGGQTSATFRQSPMGPDRDALGFEELVEAVESGDLKVEDIEKTRERLDDLIEQAEADDLSY